MMDPAIWGVIGAAIGGTGLKAIESLFKRGDKKLDDATMIRQELRSEVAALRGEVNELREEISNWQQKYYALQGEYVQLKVRYQVVSEELDRLRDRVVMRTAEPLIAKVIPRQLEDDADSSDRSDR
jgi:chromosome segregation ATPase